MVEMNWTIGNVIQTVGLLVFAVFFYFRRDTKVAELLARHDERIRTNTSDIKQSQKDVRTLFEKKADRK